MPLFSEKFPESGQKIKIKKNINDKNFYICPRNLKTLIFTYFCLGDNYIHIRCNCAKEMHLLEFTKKIYWDKVKKQGG